MFGNFIKLLLLAIIIASVVLFARDRLQPPAGDPVSAPPTAAAEPESAAPAAPAEPPATPDATVGAAVPEPPETDTAPVTPEAAATAPSASAGQESLSTGEGIVPAPAAVSESARPFPESEPDQVIPKVTGSTEPEAAPTSMEKPGAPTTEPATTVETAEEPAEKAGVEAMPALPPVHPGPDDTSLPPPTFPEHPPLTQ